MRAHARAWARIGQVLARGVEEGVEQGIRQGIAMMTMVVEQAQTEARYIRAPKSLSSPCGLSIGRSVAQSTHLSIVAAHAYSAVEYLCSCLFSGRERGKAAGRVGE